MKVLVLEDSHERIKTFKKNLKDHDVYFFDSVEDAIQAVELDGPFETFFIDHDLDHRVFVDSNEPNTGYQFAKYLAEKKIQAQFIAHTMNPAGAENIKAVLQGCIHVPFPNLF